LQSDVRMRVAPYARVPSSCRVSQQAHPLQCAPSTDGFWNPTRLMSPRTYNRPLMSRAWYMVLCLAMQPHSAGAFVHLSASWSPVSAQPSRLLHSSAQLRTTPLRRRCETSSLRLWKKSCQRIRGGAQTGAYHTLRNRCIPNVEIQSLHLYLNGDAHIYTMGLAYLRNRSRTYTLSWSRKCTLRWFSFNENEP